jgi:hypothetical protein
MTEDHVVDDFGNAIESPRTRWQRTYWRLGWPLTSDNDRVKREFVAFDETTVPAHQRNMHSRLIDWASWCRSRTGQNVASGFGLHQSSNTFEQREYGAATIAPLDKIASAQLAKEVAALPEKERQAIHWYYVYQRSPKPIDKARMLAVSLAGLRELLDRGRQILINREA